MLGRENEKIDLLGLDYLINGEGFEVSISPAKLSELKKEIDALEELTLSDDYEK